MEALETIYNFYRLSERVGTAGQPTAEQFADVKSAGYEVVINLLPETSGSALRDEREIIAQLGLEYVAIPVIWTEPTLGDLEWFFEVMQEHAGRPVFVHCAANCRASTFLFLYRVVQQGMAVEEAQQDMLRLWEPNVLWQRFIAKALAHYGKVSAA